MYMDTVFPAQVGPVQAAVSLAAVSPLTDGWARVALAPGKPQQHVTGAAASAVPGLDRCGHTCKAAGVSSWGTAEDTSGECSRLSCDTVREGATAAPGGTRSCIRVSHGRGALEMGSPGLGSCCRLRAKARGGGFLAGLSMSLGRCEHPPCGGQCPQTRPPLGPMTTPLCPACLLVQAGHRQGCCPRHVLLRFSWDQGHPGPAICQRGHYCQTHGSLEGGYLCWKQCPHTLCFLKQKAFCRNRKRLPKNDHLCFPYI